MRTPASLITSLAGARGGKSCMSDMQMEVPWNGWPSLRMTLSRSAPYTHPFVPKYCQGQRKRPGEHKRLATSLVEEPTAHPASCPLSSAHTQSKQSIFKATPENGHGACPAPNPGRPGAYGYSKFTTVPSILEDVLKLPSPLLCPHSPKGVGVPSLLLRAPVHALHFHLSGHRGHGLKENTSGSRHWLPACN